MEDQSEQSYSMANVGEKKVTQRRAIAQGVIFMSNRAFIAVRENRLPKGNVLALAEIAGVLAAKKTPDLIPLCHPLGLDQVLVRTELNENDNSIIVRCEVSANAKTGVEMEALCGVNAALLSIYDLVKPICPALKISDVHLQLKEGGKSGLWKHPDFPQGDYSPSTNQVDKHHCQTALKQIRAAILTISDRASRGETVDESGPIIERFLDKHGAEIVAFSVVADEEKDIEGFVRKYTEQEPVELIITTGGTGLGPRDVTPEVITRLSDRLVPGMAEQMRQSGMQQTQNACLSRSVVGLIGKTLIVTLPGSPKATKEGLVAIHNILPHAVSMVQGGGH